MSTNNRQFFKGFIVILLAIFVSSVAGLSPQNTAVNKGLISLNCSNSDVPSEWFVWSFTNFSSETTSNVATGCEPFNYEMYDVDDSTPNSCNLIIREARPAHAGLYTCSPGGQMASSAQLTVIETSAICSSTIADRSTGKRAIKAKGKKENQEVYKFSCGVSFSGNIAPVVTWYDGSVTGKIISSTPFTNGSYVAASFLVSTGVADVPPNLCQVSFSAPPNTSPGQATNAPEYTSSCRVEKYKQNRL